MLGDCARLWSLEIEPSAYALGYNYVAPATRADGTPAVLKLGFPGRALALEAGALRHFDGRGAVRLLEADLDLGALLLERLEPGTPLSALANEQTDERATLYAAAVMRELHRPPPHAHDFPSLADWGRGFARMRRRFDGGSGPIPRALADEAGALYRELLDSSSDLVFLHGDLHHDNILRDDARRAWLAIDPQGVVGEPAFEVGAFLRNPLPRLFGMNRPVEILARRIEVLSRELNLERARVRGWGLANAVLSAWWTIEDHGEGWEAEVKCAKLLAAVKE